MRLGNGVAGMWRRAWRSTRRRRRLAAPLETDSGGDRASTHDGGGDNEVRGTGHNDSGSLHPRDGRHGLQQGGQQEGANEKSARRRAVAACAAAPAAAAGPSSSGVIPLGPGSRPLPKGVAGGDGASRDALSPKEGGAGGVPIPIRGHGHGSCASMHARPLSQVGCCGGGIDGRVKVAGGRRRTCRRPVAAGPPPLGGRARHCARSRGSNFASHCRAGGRRSGVRSGRARDANGGHRRSGRPAGERVQHAGPAAWCRRGPGSMSLGGGSRRRCAAASKACDSGGSSAGGARRGTRLRGRCSARLRRLGSCLSRFSSGGGSHSGVGGGGGGDAAHASDGCRGIAACPRRQSPPPPPHATREKAAHNQIDVQAPHRCPAEHRVREHAAPAGRRGVHPRACWPGAQRAHHPPRKVARPCCCAEE